MAGGLIQSHDGQIFVLTARRFNWVGIPPADGSRCRVFCQSW